MAPLVALRGLTVDFDVGNRVVRVLHGIDLTVHRGEVLGLVGESGSGKSVTWLAVLRLLGTRAHVNGSVEFAGQNLVTEPVTTLEKVRGRRIAMIFQDPASALNPVHRIGRQLGEALSLHRGLSGASAKAEAKRLLDRVGIGDAERRLADYPHQLSGGQNQRVMIAMALAGEPDLLIADEPTTALDATIQAQILELLRTLRKDAGMSIVLISHDLGVVAENSDRIAVMYAGRIVEEAATNDLFARPAHPYTRGLLEAIPDLDGPLRPLVAIPGTVPQPGAAPPGCSFAPRCSLAIAECTAHVPRRRAIASGHDAACIRVPEVSAS